MPKPEHLILDANVLIDFANSELEVISLAARHLGSVFVAEPILREVDQLDERRCLELGVTLVDPTLEQLLEAGSGSGPLSFQDRLCLALARDRGLTCVTNDRRLRTECRACGVEVLWGLQLVLELVERRRLTERAAIRIAAKIHEANPRHITAAIVERFVTKVRASGHLQVNRSS